MEDPCTGAGRVQGEGGRRLRRRIPPGKILLLVSLENMLTHQQFTEEGRPAKRWAVRVVRGGNTETDVRDWEAPGGIKFVYSPRCAFCSISAPFGVNHEHVQCPYIGTLNKVRDNLGYEPVSIDRNLVICPREKKQLDVEKKLKEIDAAIADFRKQLAELRSEKDKGGKKRKAAESPAANPKDPKKPKKETKEKKVKGTDKGGKGKAGSSSKA